MAGQSFLSADCLGMASTVEILRFAQNDNHRKNQIGPRSSAQIRGNSYCAMSFTNSTIERTAMPLGPSAIQLLFSSVQAVPAMSR